MASRGIGLLAADRFLRLAVRDRSRRVIILAAGIVILSLADLIVTLAYVRAKWMVEANPIAAYLIESTRSPWPLIAFKCATVAICVALLYRVRHSLAGELASWCGLAILTVMSVMWHAYATNMCQPEDVVLAQVVATDDLTLPR